MKWVWLLCLSSALMGADERHLAMLRSAQAAFDKVDFNASPQLADASACVQSEAAMLSVASPAEENELHFKKGFCQLAVAVMTHSQASFTDAAAELDRSGANMMAWLARRAGQIGDQPTWTKPDNCPASCQPLIPVANLWLGYIALGQGNLDTAARDFAVRPGSGWPSYVAGLKAFKAANYSQAVTDYREALDSWKFARNTATPSLSLRLSPPSDIPGVLADLGGAQLLAGDAKAAVATLDQAVQASPPAARAYYLRALAKEMSGQTDPALADYNMASRTALAASTDLASGEAHLYRGIMLFRRKDYSRAEEEFASALNLQISPNLRPDASAWRHLSAVASGFCAASKQQLERALPTVSPFFPKSEAKAMVAGCPAGSPP